ncbi:heavy metal translocating P-type ATPase [Candidatus Nanohalovita haloferacivicina]|jgi:Cd2+/Zn2+-exporting ATPase|uniref:heavy metal translocating P-type ATPase n=1 Tax=Candidatus Nanohalovita haloferacivicina TaxID=2978046 RepID=UPI00325FAAF7|nr:Cation transport ATPase [Candidatus Nanohalobia archaeon BNXNv]
MSDEHDKSHDEDLKEDEAEFMVPEMDCASCAAKIENSLDNIEGINEYSALTTVGKVTVNYNSSKISEFELIDAIESVGYSVKNKDNEGAGHNQSNGGDIEEEGRKSVWKSSRAIKTWIAGIFLGAGLLFKFGVLQDFQIAQFLGREFFIAEILFLAGIASGSPVILRNGYYSAKKLNLDIDFLMSTAILSAVSASFAFGAELYFEAATLVFLFNVAELLETYSMDKARNSLRELMNLSPDTATVKRDGEETEIPVEQVKIGDIVITRPGEKIPMDGEVIDGESAVNQAPITGESMPVDKKQGDEVYAGTINEEGYLEIEVTKDSSDNTLSKIVQMVEDAESSQTKREQFVERFSEYYTPFMVTLAVLTATVPPLLLGMSWTTWFLAGITMLVLACPCAFVISTPVTVVSGITSAAKNGVLIKGGKHLEATGEIEAIAFDKTGTLTKGELAVTDIVPVNGKNEEDVLKCARGLETRSEHPLGDAIIKAAQSRGIEPENIQNFESITGKGVKAKLAGKEHYAGKPDLFSEKGFNLKHVHTAMTSGEISSKSRELCERNDCMDLLDEKVPELQSQGKTVIVVGNEDRVEGLIAVADKVREEAAETIERLHEQGIKTMMLTGDNERTGKAIAEQVGVGEYHAELLPEQKVEKIQSLVEKYDGVAMVGDGVNDAPALATATVGVAMGAAGTDTALETADVALMGDDLSKIPYLYKLSHTANGVIRQNIYSSLLVKLLLAIGVPLQIVTVAIAVLIGDAGMTVGVTGNAMRLSRIEAE